MKIIIASKDRTAELGPALKAGADASIASGIQRRHPEMLTALTLRDAKNEQDFLERWSELIRRRSHLDTMQTDFGHKPGAAGALALRIREFLWKIFRYQHNQLARQQTLINTQLVAALEFQKDEIAKLRARIDELEKPS